MSMGLKYAAWLIDSLELLNPWPRSPSESSFGICPLIESGPFRTTLLSVYRIGNMVGVKDFLSMHTFLGGTEHFSWIFFNEVLQQIPVLASAPSKPSHR